MSRDAGSRHGWNLPGKRKAGEAHGGGPKKGWARLEYEIGTMKWERAPEKRNIYTPVSPIIRTGGRDILHPRIEAVLYREMLRRRVFQHAPLEVCLFEQELPCDGIGSLVEVLRCQRKCDLRGNIQPAACDQRHGALVVGVPRVVMRRKVPLRLGGHEEHGGEMEQHDERHPPQEPLRRARAWPCPGIRYFQLGK